VIEFQYPLTPEDRQRAASLLKAGESCQVGEYRLYSDGRFIETASAYGLPAIWSEESAADDALRWVDDQYAHEAAERAEYAAYMVGGP
jgi:hypothetical protein